MIDPLELGKMTHRCPVPFELGERTWGHARYHAPVRWLAPSTVVLAVSGCSSAADPPIGAPVVELIEPSERPTEASPEPGSWLEGVGATTAATGDAPRASSSPAAISGEDGELFEAAGRAMTAGDTQKALTLYVALVRDHPKSPHVPAAYLAFAEHHFAEGKLAEAQRFYERVAGNPASDLAPFARYKLAWTHFNLGRGAEALAALVGVLGNGAASDALRAAARKDLPRFFAEVGDPKKARAAFRQWVDGPAEVERLVRALAQVYADQGKIQERDALLASP